MSRTDDLRRKVASLESDASKLTGDLRKSEAAVAKAREAVAKKKAELAKARTESSRRMAENSLRQLERTQDAAQKKVEDAQKKVATNARASAATKSSLAAAEKSDLRTRDREDANRRRQELSHAREVARLSTTTVRHIVVTPPKPEPLRVLYLTANPEAKETEIINPDGSTIRQGTWLRVDAEVRLVRDAIRKSEFRDLVELDHRPAASWEDLLDGINDNRPHVVHFSGHGGLDGLLMDNGSVDDPAGVEMGYDLLRRTLKATNEPPKLLVLNACETTAGTDELLDAVPVVIAMQESISDQAASAFATAFYAALASAQPVSKAFDQSILRMGMVALGEVDTPLCSAVDGLDLDELVLVKPNRDFA